MAATALGATDHAARQAFGVFFTSHHRELGRLAYLLSGDQDAAEDRVRQVEEPPAKCGDRLPAGCTKRLEGLKERLG